MKRNLILLLISATLFGCKWSNAPLGDNYWYLDVYEAQDVGYPGGAIIYRSKERYSFDEVLIEGNVIAETHNDKYVIAKQLPINDNQIENYFIIDKVNEIVYGPLSIDSLNTLKAKKEILLELK